MLPLQFFKKRPYQAVYTAEDAEMDAAIDMVAVGLLETPSQHGGSRPGKKPNKPRNFGLGYSSIVRDYFGDSPVYSERDFLRRFRMNRRVFCRLLDDLPNNDPWLLQRMDALKLPGLSTLQKLTAACRMLAYGVAADAVDEYIRMSELLARECLEHVVDAIVLTYEDQYLRAPTPADIDRIQQRNATAGWPGLAFSIDSMHWEWKVVPNHWQGNIPVSHVCQRWYWKQLLALIFMRGLLPLVTPVR